METESLRTDETLVGRGKEVEELVKLFQKRKSVLLIGHPGTGKTAILRHIYKQFDDDRHRIIYIEESAPLKDTLIHIAREIHTKYRDLQLYELGDKEEDITQCEWKDIKRKVCRLRNRDLAGVTLKSVKGKDYIIILDHLERVTPTAKSVVEVFLDRACLVGSYSGYPQSAGSSLKKLWWRFHKVEIKNLTIEEANTLIDYYFEKYNILSEDPRKYKRQIFRVSKGNPLAIKDICHNGSLEKYVDKRHIRELEHEAGTRYFDVAPLLILGICVVVMLRFFALGVNDMDTYILAGGMGALGLFIRFVMFRYTR